jgi:hypothetical protein
MTPPTIAAPSIVPTHCRDRDWWRRESARLGSDWNGVMQLAIENAISEAQDDPWDNPGWAEAAEEYQKARGNRVSVIDIAPADVRRIKALLEPSVSLERAYWQIQNQPRPTPETVVDAILYCVQARGLAALKEPKNIERLSRCDAAALAEVDRRVAKINGGQQ